MSCRLVFVVAGALLPLAVACSSADDPVASTAPVDASASSSGGASSGSTSSGSTSSGSALADASTPDATADAASSVLPIDPIEVGNSWTYDVTELGTYPRCPGGSHTSSVVTARELADKTALTVESLCQDLGPYDYAVDGDRVFTYDPIASAWTLALDAPVEEGHVWTASDHDFVWRAQGVVTVPAGTFSDCWAATELAEFESYTVFCRGVGPVHWHYEDGFGNGYDALLTAKNF